MFFIAKHAMEREADEIDNITCIGTKLTRRLQPRLILFIHVAENDLAFAEIREPFDETGDKLRRHLHFFPRSSRTSGTDFHMLSRRSFTCCMAFTPVFVTL